MTSAVPAVAVGVDYPAGPSRALDWAAQEALARSAPLRLVTGWTGAAHDDPDLLREGFLKASARKLLEETARLTELSHPGLAVICEVVDADARYALERHRDGVQLLVVGARRAHRFPDRLLGSTSLHLAATAGGPVVVVPEDPYAGLSVRGDGPVVLGVDGRDPGRDLVAFAFETAVREDAPLRVVHAWHQSPTGGPDGVFALADEGRTTAEQDMRLHETLAPWRARYPEVDLHADTVHSGAVRALVRLSRQARLVVVGRHGQPTGPLGRLGSVSQGAILSARCPVAVVPAP
ncbi:universal stress protein [Streptacidiphilus melanogenes]|uniref:universal stress protein n=1 Tax=Streptacidiphilus melanogenes TaxID=411235 RepID=UPI000693B03A|nr:universal stress protein [Streptacidiphilus melanogenes]